MISIGHARRFCKDDISKIENYDKAISDTSQTWVLHHKLELTLNGEFAHSRTDLIRFGMYFKRPYFELIFLPKFEHQRLHKSGKNNPMYGNHFTSESRRKISDAVKSWWGERGKVVLSHETRKKMTKVKTEHRNAYHQYKSNGGTMSWNEFQSSFKATESEI